MSLESLRAQAEAEETETIEAVEPEQTDEPEPEEAEADTDEGSSDEDGEDAETVEESDDFELELDGEPEPGQQKPSPEQALIYKLTKAKGQKRELKDQVEELQAKLAELQGQGSNQAQPQSKPQPQQQAEQYPPVPVLYEKGINTPEAYQQAYQKWVADCKAVDQRAAEQDKSRSEYRRQIEEKTHKLAERAGKFATEHKIKGDRVVSAFERATSEIDSATKIEGALVHLLDAVGDGSERVAYYIGTNDTAMAQVKQLLQEDPNGLRAISHMTRLAEKLRPNQRLKTSKAPDPDRPIKGDGSSASAKSIQDKYDKCKDPKEMMRLRKKARELGVKLT